MTNDLQTYLLKAGFLQMTVTNFGARVMGLQMPDRNGNPADIVLGYTRAEEYLQGTGERFLGSVIGRVGNRIANAQFELFGKIYRFAPNNNGQCLHGGWKGLDRVFWEVVSVTENAMDFHYLSPDGEEGFPGNLDIYMRYELTADNEFSIEYKASTDAPTHVNLTHHSFFNLKGEGQGDINDHWLEINADAYLPVDARLIPLGEPVSVAHTPMDFRTPAQIGSRIDEDDHQLRMGNGYDHCWVLARPEPGKLNFAARVQEMHTGRTMEVWTDQPGMQFYGGNFLDGKTPAKSGKGVYAHRGAFALETQHFPDTPNRPEYPSTLLLPGETYRHRCVYRFSIA